MEMKNLKLHITGECTISREDKWQYPLYKARLYNEREGKYLYHYIQIHFLDKPDLPDNTDIKINDGFFSFFKKNDGSKEVKIIVSDYEILNEIVGDIDIPMNNSYDDIPF